MIKLLLTGGVIILGIATTLGFSRGNTGTTGGATVGTATGETSITGSLAGGSTASATPSPLTDKSGPAKTKQLKELNLDDSRQVYIYGVIDENSAPVAAKQILELGKDSRPINILINSPGGSVLDGAAIISAMQAARGPVNTVCVEICASMAAMIHSYGTHRLMIDRSFVMFHPATGGVEGEVDKMYSRLGSLKDYIGDLELNAATRAGMSYQEYKFKSGVEMWLSAKNAIATHYADDIVFVRGEGADKLFVNPEAMKYINTKLPFQNVPNGKFYWISTEAYNMLYGQSFGVVVNGR
jgi:ATP-dependent Clp protease, protease subunit